MVDELVDSVQNFQIIRVRGVPISGKATLMMSPEFLIKPNTESGPINFYIAQKKWGIVILRDNGWLEQQMQRIQDSQELEEYILLQFTASRPTEALPGNYSVHYI